MPPIANRMGAFRVYSVLYGGCLWHTVVASHLTVDPANPFVFSETGELGMPTHDLMQLPKIDFEKQIRFAWKGAP